jgi:hypothetical protein
VNRFLPRTAIHAAGARQWRQAGLVVVCLLLAACGSLPRNATPPEAALDGEIPGFPEVRGWALQARSTLEQDLVRSFAQESLQDFPPDASGTVRYARLALSGGAAPTAPSAPASSAAGRPLASARYSRSSPASARER